MAIPNDIIDGFTVDQNFGMAAVNKCISEFCDPVIQADGRDLRAWDHALADLHGLKFEAL